MLQGMCLAKFSLTFEIPGITSIYRRTKFVKVSRQVSKDMYLLMGRNICS